jgi:toxin ParE1/3/4
VKNHVVMIDVAAERDLNEIVTYIAENDSIERALLVSANIEKAIARLSTFPNRGPHPKELVEHGIRDFREIHFKPYRIIYRIAGDMVVVVLIADGRRDMRALLARRLLSA